MTTKRNSKKESKILAILYWRRVCKRLLELHQELNQIKQHIAREALYLCKNAIKTFQDNNIQRRHIQKQKRLKRRQEAVPAA